MRPILSLFCASGLLFAEGPQLLPFGGGGPATGCGNPTPGMAGWYRMDDTSNVCTGGCSGTNVVTTMHDGSGNGLNLVNGSSGNTYVSGAVNSLPGVQFCTSTSAACTFTFNNGSSTSMNWCNASTSDCAFFVVFKVPSVSAAHFFFGDSGQAPGFEITSGAVFGLVSLGDHLIGTATNTLSASTYYQANIIEHVISGNVQNTTTVREAETADTFTISSSTRQQANITTVGNDGGSANFLGGVVTEMIFYTTSVTPTVNEAYLRCRYGI